MKLNDIKLLQLRSFLSPGLSAIIPSETNTSSPQELLANYDSDKDGSITFEELKSAVEKVSSLN